MPDEIELHSSCVSQVTCISNDFIDNFMPSSSGEFVKTYLYLLRCVSQNACRFSVRAVADALNHTEGDIRRALEYWEKKGLIRIEYDSTGAVYGICVLSRPMEDQLSVTDMPESSFSSEDVEDINSSSKSFSDVKKEGIEDIVDDTNDLYEVSEEDDFSEDDFNEADFEEIFRVAEQFKGKPLSSNEMKIIMTWKYDLKFSVDLIEYLIEMSMNNNHPSFYYMNAIAMKWKEDGITTEVQAKCADSVHSKSYYSVVKAFGIKQRNLNKRELAVLNRWTDAYGFSDEMISEACERALANTGKVSFSYADKILSDWSTHNIKTLSDVRKKDSDRRVNRVKTPVKNQKTTSFQDFTQRPKSSSELSDLERKLLQ
jgi:DnaD/phage-associated family protein